MENLKEYQMLVNEILINRKEQIPNGNGTISSLIARIEKYKEVITEIDVALAELGNNYIEKNNSTQEQIIEIKKINRETIIEFTNSLEIPGINAQ